MDDFTSETSATPRWWQYLICATAIANSLTAVIGTFVFFSFPCFLMLMTIAMAGAVFGAYKVVQGLTGARKICVCIVFAILGLAFVIWSAEAWKTLATIAFRLLVGQP